MPTDEAMLNEAILAARAGDKARARDLLTRLLQLDKNVPDHWLWMSAVVETRQEQIYCLQNLLRLDPHNEVARKGLIMMGELKPSERDITTPVPRRKQAWSVTEIELNRPRGWKAVMANPMLRSIVYITAIVIAVAGLTGGAISLRNNYAARPTPDFKATAAAVGAVVTLTPTNTPVPTATNIFNTPTPTPGVPTPLAQLLEATYTPTPRYVDTPHPQSEAFRLGLLAQARGDWESMASFMQQTIDLEPAAADAYYYLGIAYLEMGEASKAYNAFVQAGITDSQFGPAFLGRALARLAMDPDADVSRDFQIAISRASDFGLIYIERARYFISRNQFDGAQNDLATAETLMPDSPAIPYLRALMAFKKLDYIGARLLATEAIEKDRTNLDAYLLLGEIEFASGEMTAAVEWFRTYTRYAPDDLDANGKLGLALAQTGEYQEALDIFDRLLEGNATSAMFYLGRGQVHLAAGNYQAAFKDLNQANRLQRNNYNILLALSIAMIETGDPGNAYVTLNETLPLAKNAAAETIVYFYRGRALFDLVENGDSSSRPAAVRDLEKALENSDFLSSEIVLEARLMLDQLKATP